MSLLPRLTGGDSGEKAVVRSGPSIGGGGRVTAQLEIVCRDKDGKITSRFEKPMDMTLLQSAQFFVANQLNVSGLSFKDTSGTAHAQTAQPLSGTPQIAFGTGGSAATWSDNAIQTSAGGATNPVTAVVSAITPSGSSGTFTVTATWTNSTAGTITVTELALYVTTTAGMASNSTFALTHDTFTGQAVSPSGTAAATLTYTWS